MRVNFKIASCALALLALPSAAQAVVLTFEGAFNNTYTAPIVRDGYTIGNVVGDEQHFHELDSTAFPGFTVSNGTGVLYNDRDTRIFIENLASPFTFTGFDASAVLGPNEGGGATSLLVEGYLGGILVNSASFTIGSSFASFGGLTGTFDRLVFDGSPAQGGFELDNVALDVAAIPEPATWAMMLLGFGAVGLSVRRRKVSGSPLAA